MIQDNPTTNETSRLPLVINVVDRDSMVQQRIEVSHANCTIGSGNQATVQLDSAGLKPCHCEIVRNPSGVYVRQLGDTIHINGQNLAEAWIFPGDHITFASLDVEIVDVGQLDFAERQENLQSRIDTVQFAVEAELVDTTPVPPVSEPSVAPDSQPFSTAWSDDEEKDEQAEWLDQLYDSAMEDEAEGVKRQPDLPVDPSLLGWSADSIAPQLRQPNLDPSQFSHLPQPTVEEANRVLDQIEGNFPPEPAAPVQSQADAPVEPTANQPVVPVEPPPAPELQDVTGVLRQLENEETFHPPEFKCVPENKESESMSISEPVQCESVADVLARMRESGAIDQPLPGESNFGSEPVETNHNMTAPVAPAPVQEPPANPSGDDDASVQEYMNQLMQRLRGGEPVAAPPTQETAPAATVAATVASDPQVEKSKEDLIPENPMSVTEFRPQNTAPEKSSTLNALRQIANQSVENAINKSAREKNIETSLIYLGGSGVSLFFSAILFTLSNGIFDMSFLLAIVFAIGCVAMCFKYLSAHSERNKLQNAPRTNELENDAADVPEPPVANS